MMSSVEESVRYVAPSDVYDDIRFVWKRLDLLASHTENEIMYKAPGIKENLAVEFDDRDNNYEAGENEFLSDNRKPYKK
jgi:hypothetical protein